MLGAGKYDDLCQEIIDKTKADGGVMLFVIDGEKGTGVSCKLRGEAMMMAPEALRLVADDLEKDMIKIAMEKVVEGVTEARKD